MAQASTGGPDGDGGVDSGGGGAGGDVELGGNRQELKRTLGSFQVFAISFAFISVAVGVFATYDEVLRTAGPVGIWLWPAAAVGQTLVALVVAQFAARIPLSGSSYQWASRLGSPRVGWWFGWLTFCYLAIAVVAIDNALASQAFMPLAGIAEDEGTARVITLVVLFLQAVLAIASTRLVGWINSAAVGLEVVLVVGRGDRPPRRRGGHGRRLARQPHLARRRRARARLLRRRRGPDARDDHGSRHPRASTPPRTWPRRPRTPTAASPARSWGRSSPRGSSGCSC
ncbi:APC family permease [Streptomyces erythrochromogenes]|uniref:APC family permease n=1 Tax=Streptomyces erythrochromogenes TaxID=285574 RepID=UPI0036FB7772